MKKSLVLWARKYGICDKGRENVILLWILIFYH